MISAIGYVRRSTTKQETSLEEQRAEIEKYASVNGYCVVRWYTESISGATADDRPEFQRMVADADTKRDFSVVLCWNSARFGRMDPDEIAHYRFLLKRLNVSVVYIAEENIEGDAGNIFQTVRSIQNHSYLKTLSRDVTRGALHTFQNGGLPGRTAPYGFDRMLVDDHGKPQQRLKRGQRVFIQKGWKMTLVPNDDGVEVSTVREIYETYHKEEVGCSEIANRLHIRGVPAPRGGEWSSSTIIWILQNPIYKGILSYGVVTLGKFHRISGDSVIAAPKDSKTTRNSVENCVQRFTPELAIVPLDLWDDVNRKRQSRALDKAQRARGRSKSRPLSGIAICGNCNGPMLGMRHGGKNRVDRCYVCARHFRNKTCSRNSIREERLHKLVRDIVVDRIFRGGELERLTEVIKQKLQLRGASDNSSEIKRQLAEAKSSLVKAAKNMLSADSDNLPDLNKAMTEIRQRVRSLEAELSEVQRQTDPQVLIQKIISKAKQLLIELFDGDIDRLRSVMGKLVKKIDLKFKPITYGKRSLHQVSECDIYLFDDLTTEQLGNPISIAQVF